MEIRIFRCLVAVQLLVLVACEDPAGRNLNLRTVVRTEYGQVRGVVKRTVLGRDYLSFQGIPYMKPPVGKLRFKAPEPPVRWTNILDATKEVPGYTQFHAFRQKIWGHENASVINVYTPAIYRTNLLPVIVYIHGGSFKVRWRSTLVQLQFVHLETTGRFRQHRALQPRLPPAERRCRRHVQLSSWYHRLLKLEGSKLECSWQCWVEGSEHGVEVVAEEHRVLWWGSKEDRSIR
jgi:hypothetical protein